MSILKRETLIARIILAMILAFLSKATASIQTETFRDAIEKSQNLFLQGARGQALRLLVAARKKESKKPAANKELQQAFQQIGYQFVSDKAQSTFEVGLSILPTDAKAALNKFLEAQKLEEENLSIELQVVRTLLQMSDCDKAKSRSLKLEEFSVFSEEIVLLQAQINLCLGNFSEFTKLKINELKKSELAIFWLVAESEYFFKSSAFSKLSDTADQAIRLNSGYPEPYFWKWKALVEKKESAEPLAQKYVSVCKTLTARKYREFLVDPTTCTRVAEVESFLKKDHTPEK